MTAWRLATRNFLRGLRAGRLTVLMVALTVAVAAITSVGFFIDRVHARVAQEAAGMLAADLRLNGSEPLNPDYLAEAQRRGMQTAQFTSFPTVVVAGDASQLASLNAVSDAYPLSGQVRLAAAVGSSASYAVGQCAACGRRVARGRTARAPRHRCGGRRHDRRTRIRRRPRAEAPARPVARLRYVCAVALDESLRPRVDGPHPAG